MFNGGGSLFARCTSRMTPRVFKSGSVRGSGEIPRGLLGIATGSNQQQIRPCPMQAESGSKFRGCNSRH